MPLGIIKIFGNVAASGFLEYRSPRGRVTTITNFAVCNPTTIVHIFSAAVAIGGVPAVPSDFFLVDVPVGPKDTFIHTAPIILSSKGLLRLENADDALTFTAFGQVTG